MIQVAFAGHARPGDLGRHEPVSEALAAAFALIRAAGVREARMIAGLASGADELAAAAWRAEGLGPIHAVMPHLDETDSGQARAAEMADGITWLDGDAFEAEGRNAHLKQSRFIVEAADLLVVVWTGAAARGVGGTADAVQCALEIGLPVLWIKPSEAGPLRLIRPDALPLDFHFPEFQTALEGGHLEHVEDATPDGLKATLKNALHRPPPPPPPPRPVDDWLHKWLWRTHANFRKLLGGRMHGLSGDPPPPEDLAAQPGFRALTDAYNAADQVANRLSAVHRSEQLLLVTAMVLAALVGSAWTIWPEVKLTAVWIELMITVGALLIWAAGSDARQHERWSESRYLAERLRLERAGWALGVSVASASPSASGGSGAWRSARQSAGLPDGRFDHGRIATWGAWSLHELIHGQRAYHRATSERDERIAHRIHTLEDASFWVLFVSFAFYVSYTAVTHYYPKWTSGLIAMIGSVVPAIAAASMALEAKLEFQEQSARSRRMAAALDGLAGKLTSSTSLDKLQNAAREAIRLHMAEASHWREGSGRRRLLRA